MSSPTTAHPPGQWQNIPFAPRRWPFFYGWAVVAATTVGVIASIPGQTMGVGVFTDHLISALGLTRVQLSTAYMIATIFSSFLLPLAGTALDRLGGRTMVVGSAIGLGISMLALSLAGSDRLSALNGNDSLYLAMAVITACFLAMRFFGQGCLTMGSRVTLSKWFDHRRGLATAISGVFIAFGFNGSPVALNWLVETAGWRGAALILAGAVGIGMSVLAWVFYRDNPEECGLVMDGVHDEAWRARMAARVPETRMEFTRREASRTGAFWVFALGTATQSLAITAITFHIASLGAESGLSRGESYAVFWPMSFFGIAANFIGGWASDRTRLKYLLLIMMAAQAIGTTGSLDFGEPTGRMLFTVGYGVSGGLFGTLTTVTWPRFFGRRHLGAISGLHMSIMVFASAIGPVLFAEARSITGSYQEVILACWFMPVAVLLAGLGADNPQERLEPEALTETSPVID
jgi:sugar phosphate permease